MSFNQLWDKFGVGGWEPQDFWTYEGHWLSFENWADFLCQCSSNITFEELQKQNDQTSISCDTDMTITTQYAAKLR